MSSQEWIFFFPLMIQSQNSSKLGITNLSPIAFIMDINVEANMWKGSFNFDMIKKIHSFSSFFLPLPFNCVYKFLNLVRKSTIVEKSYGYKAVSWASICIALIMSFLPNNDSNFSHASCGISIFSRCNQKLSLTLDFINPNASPNGFVNDQFL